jgi:hypothetical protein
MKYYITPIWILIFLIYKINAEPVQIFSDFTSHYVSNVSYLNNKAIFISSLNIILSFNTEKNRFDTIYNINSVGSYYLNGNKIIGINTALQKIYVYDYISGESIQKDYRFVNMGNYTVEFYTGKYIAVRNKTELNINVYDLDTKSLVKEFSESNNSPCDKLYNTPNERYLIGIDNYNLFKYDISINEIIKSVELPPSSGLTYISTPSDTTFVISAGSNIQFYNLDSFELLGSIENANILGNAIKVQGDNNLIYYVKGNESYNKIFFDYTTFKEVPIPLTNTGLKNKIPYIDAQDTFFLDWTTDEIIRFNYHTAIKDTIFNSSDNKFCIISTFYKTCIFEESNVFAEYFHDFNYSIYKIYGLENITNFRKSNYLNISKYDEHSVYYLKNSGDSIIYIADVLSKQILDSVTAYKPDYSDLEPSFDFSKQYLINREIVSGKSKHSIYDFKNRKTIFQSVDSLVFSEICPSAVKEINTIIIDNIKYYNINFKVLPDTNTIFTTSNIYSEISADGIYIFYPDIQDSTLIKHNIETNLESEIHISDEISNIYLSTDNQYLGVKFYNCGYGISIYRTDDLSLVYRLEPDNFIDDGNFELLLSSNFKYLFFTDKLTYFEGYTLNLKSSSVENQNNKYSLLSIYPNPTNNYINISSALIIKDISIYNIEGQELYYNPNTDLNLETINLQNFPNGIYYIKAIIGNHKVTKQFIISK